jgi:hypothetical protein
MVEPARLGDAGRPPPRHGPRRVAVARKLGVILHRMWCYGADFRFGKVPTAAAA